jgi:hypothetical protein
MTYNPTGLKFIPIIAKFGLNKKINFTINKNVNTIAKQKTVIARKNTILKAISNHINIFYSQINKSSYK